MNALTELVGTHEEIEKGTIVRTRVWPLIESLHAPEGVILSRNKRHNSLSREQVEHIRAVNNAKAWAIHEKRVSSFGNRAINRADVLYIALTLDAVYNGKHVNIEQPLTDDENAAKIARFLDLPTLTGTEKQVSWATTLREKARRLAEKLGEMTEFEALAKSREGKTAKFWIAYRREDDMLGLLGWTIGDGPVNHFAQKYHHLDGISWRKMTSQEHEISEARRRYEREMLAKENRIKHVRKHHWK